MKPETCRECRVNYRMDTTGYPDIDPVEVCPRHALVDKLAEALRYHLKSSLACGSFEGEDALATYDRLKEESNASGK